MWKGVGQISIEYGHKADINVRKRLVPPHIPHNVALRLRARLRARLAQEMSLAYSARIRTGGRPTRAVVPQGVAQDCRQGVSASRTGQSLSTESRQGERERTGHTHTFVHG